MNVLINRTHTDEQFLYALEEEKDKDDSKTFGYILAVALIGGYTFFALVVSVWSAFLFFTGNVASGPIELIFNKILAAGIV